MTTVDWDELWQRLAAVGRTLEPDIAVPPEVRDATLKERARRLAREEPKSLAAQQIEIIVFKLGAANYAIETEFVREVHPLNQLTPIPCTPAFILGVINLRGELCPLIELRCLLGLPEQGLTNATRAVIMHSTQMDFGIVADAIVGVQSLAVGEIRPPPATLSGLNARFLRGMTADRTIIFDAATILAHPGLIVNESVDG